MNWKINLINFKVRSFTLKQELTILDFTCSHVFMDININYKLVTMWVNTYFILCLSLFLEVKWNKHVKITLESTGESFSTGCHSGNQRSPYFLWNPKSITGRQASISVLSRVSPLHTINFILKSISILSSHLWLRYTCSCNNTLML